MLVIMKKQALFLIGLLFFCGEIFSQNKKDDKVKHKDSYLLFELGIVYPELEFIDSRSEQSLNSDLTNISSNRIVIGGGGSLVNRLGYLLTLSSNRYDSGSNTDTRGIVERGNNLDYSYKISKNH